MTDEPKAVRPLSFDPVAGTLAYETTPTGRVHAFDLAPRGDRASYFVLDDAAWFPWEHVMDARPRQHPEPPFAPFMAEHVNCRCVLVEDARTAIVEHEDTLPPLFRNVLSWGGRALAGPTIAEMLDDGTLRVADEWASRSAGEIYADVKALHDMLLQPPEWSSRANGVPPWGFDVDRYRKGHAEPMELRVARHGPFGGLTRYGKPYAGRATVHGAPPPLSKRARRRARGKAKS